MSSAEEDNHSSDDETVPKGKDYVPFDALDAAEAGINHLSGLHAYIQCIHAMHTYMREYLSVIGCDE